MGTHPIFESDFDCLTECVRKNHHGNPLVGYRTFILTRVTFWDVQ